MPTSPPGRPKGEPRSAQHEAAPVSAARLAAEAAFEQPTLGVVQNTQAQITVRRARVLVATDQPAPRDPVSALEPVRKGPRVFRVETAAGLASAAAPSAPPLQVHPNGATPALKSRKRRASEKRPGPVRLVVPGPTAAPVAAPEQPAPGAGALACQLQRIEPVLAAIAQARAFWIVDHRVESHYERLLQQAQELLQELL